MENEEKKFYRIGYRTFFSFQKMSKRFSRVSFVDTPDEIGQITFHPQSSENGDPQWGGHEENEQLKQKPEDEIRENNLSPTSSIHTSASSFEKFPAVTLANFFTLKVLIFDIGLALGDVASDFAQVLVFLLKHIS